MSYAPKRDVRDSLRTQVTTDRSKDITEMGKLLLSFSTGQSLSIPIEVNINTPFIFASSPDMELGVCQVGRSCTGIILLSNPTSSDAYYSITPVPGSGATTRPSAIRVQGFYNEAQEPVDDPSVFTFSPQQGKLQGPTVSASSALAAPPKDETRL